MGALYMDYDLKLGERLDIILGEHRCVSKLVEITKEGTMIITEPIYRSETITIMPENLINIIYYRTSGMYSCTVVVARRIIDNDQVLLEIEIRSPISKYQRRDFVRFETVIPVQAAFLASAEEVESMSAREILRYLYDKRFMGIQRDEDGEKLYEGTTLDISGGGTRFALSHYFELGTMVEITLTLNEDTIITVDGQIVRVDENYVTGLRYMYGTKFVNIEERIRRQIIRYIFDEQVKRRQK